jgi:hypothetical protein
MTMEVIVVFVMAMGMVMSTTVAVMTRLMMMTLDDVL